MSSTIFSPERQLVYEWYTPSLEKSLNFLQAFGFVVLRQEDNFAELSWGLKNRLMVEQMQEYSDQQENVAGYRGYHGNLRVLVDDVDSVYQAALLNKDAKILKELGDRYYGLRDFTVGGPYGFALRFAKPLQGFSEH